ncbi:MAG: hypothetical protein V5A68_08085 [Candidatus Thermoplasmatota archaeon]
MIKTTYNVCEKFGWNQNRSFPLEPILQKNIGYRRAYYMLLQPLSAFSKGFNFMKENWDYAIVLDSCRYDVFEKVNWIPGRLQKKQSIASATMEWIKKTITKDFMDTVVITANPFLSPLKLREITGKAKRFYKNIPAWEIGLDRKLGVAPPWTMLEMSKKRIKKFKDKKMLFWFNQPHSPYLKYDKKRDEIIKGTSPGSMASGESSMKEMKEDYVANLVIVLEYISKLVEYLDGKIIITADHGECFGEMGVFTHPQRVHIPPLVDVPYFEIEK